MNDLFRRFAQWVSRTTGNAYAFSLAFIVVVLWLVSGPFFGYSDTWQLVINTATTVVTFLMVFILQNTQDRDSRATQLKLDELLRAVTKARNSYIDIEEVPDEELDKLTEEFQKMHESAQREKETRTRKRSGSGHGGSKSGK